MPATDFILFRRRRGMFRSGRFGLVAPPPAAVAAPGAAACRLLFAGGGFRCAFRLFGSRFLRLFLLRRILLGRLLLAGRLFLSAAAGGFFGLLCAGLLLFRLRRLCLLRLLLPLCGLFAAVAAGAAAGTLFLGRVCRFFALRFAVEGVVRKQRRERPRVFFRLLRLFFRLWTVFQQRRERFPRLGASARNHGDFRGLIALEYVLALTVHFDLQRGAQQIHG